MRSFTLLAAAIAALLALGGPACGPSVEADDLCSNDFDDDGDGRIDCEDESCAFAGACGDCGNGVIDGSESCDDGNVTDGDGCSSRCISDACAEGGCVVDDHSTRCGDRVLQPSEECDDGNRDNGDGCSSTCTGEAGFCDAHPELRQCDDGNSVSGDTCSSACLFEFCGDGIVQPTLGERCDDAAPGADLLNCFGCQIPICGNFRRESGEVCDDGNTVSGDGCGATCRDFN